MGLVASLVVGGDVCQKGLHDLRGAFGDQPGFAAAAERWRSNADHCCHALQQGSERVSVLHSQRFSPCACECVFSCPSPSCDHCNKTFQHSLPASARQAPHCFLKIIGTAIERPCWEHSIPYSKSIPSCLTLHMCPVTDSYTLRITLDILLRD